MAEKLRIGFSIGFDIDRLTGKLRYWPGFWVNGCMNFKACGQYDDTEMAARMIARAAALREYRARKQVLFHEDSKPCR